MISRDVELIINNNSATLTEPITVYMYDRGIQLNVTVKEYKYKTGRTVQGLYIEDNNIYKASAVIKSPDGKVFKYPQVKAEVSKNVVKILITKEWTDEADEAGIYQVQLQLFDDEDSRVSLPPFPITVEKLIFPYDDGAGGDTSGYADVSKFDSAFIGIDGDIVDNSDIEKGDYSKTNWKTNMPITAANLNKLENRLDEVYSGDGIKKTEIDSYNTNAKTTEGAINELKDLIGALQNDINEFVAIQPGFPSDEIPALQIDILDSHAQLAVGNSAALNYSILPNNHNDTVVWSTSDSKVVSVSSNGLIKALSEGTATIKCRSYNNPAVYDEIVMNVVNVDINPIRSIQLSAEDLRVLINEEVKVIASTEPADHTDTLVWSSSDENVATVDGKGVVTTKGPGTVSIICKSSGDFMIYDVLDLAVDASVVPVTEIKLPELLEVRIGEDNRYDLDPVFVPSNTTQTEVIWSSSNTDLATIDENGIIEVYDKGEVTITCKSKDNPKVFKECTLRCMKTVEEIIVEPVEILLDKNKTCQLTCSFVPEDTNETEVVWESSMPARATVDEKTGLVTTHDFGDVFIRCRSLRNSNVVGSCKLTVENIPITGITLTPEKGGTLYLSERINLAYEITPANTTEPEIVWETSDNTVAIVENGLVKIVGKGQATITCKSEKRPEIKATYNVNAETARLELVKGLPRFVDAGQSYQLETQIYFDTDFEMEWVSSNPKVATVSKSGLVEVISNEGEFNITGYLKADPDVNVSMDCIVAVYPDSITIHNDTDGVEDEAFAIDITDLDEYRFNFDYTVKSEREYNMELVSSSIPELERDGDTFLIKRIGKYKFVVSAGKVTDYIDVAFEKEFVRFKTTGSTSLYANGQDVTSKLKEISNEDGVKTYSFTSMNDIKNMRFIDSNSETGLTEIVRIDTSCLTSTSYMFKDCKQLSSIDITNWNMSNVTDTSHMFEGCSKLKAIDGFVSLLGEYPVWDNISVEDMSYMFSGCESLLVLNIADLNTANVKKMNNMFEGCSKLTSLDLNKWNTGKVVNTTYMFSHCENLVTLNIGDWNVSNVTDMKYMFSHCSLLASLFINNWDVSNVTDMKYMFDECNALTSLTLNKWDTSKVADMKFMFNKCKNLTSLDISNWKFIVNTTLTDIIFGCEVLFELNMSNWLFDDVISMNRLVEDCFVLRKINMSNWHAGESAVSINNATDIIMNCEGVGLINASGWHGLTIPTISYIYSGAFEKKIEEINFDGWRDITIGNLTNTFPHCPKLKEIKMKNWTNVKITNIDTIFDKCGLCVGPALELCDMSNWKNISITKFTSLFGIFDRFYIDEVNLNNWENVMIENMGSLFNGLSLLKSISLNNWKYVVINDMSNLLAGCDSLEKASMDNWQRNKISNMAGMFLNCNSLKTLKLTNWTYVVVENMASALYNCYSLEKFAIKNWDTVGIGDLTSMLENCTSLIALNIDNVVDVELGELTYVLAQCNSLKIVTCNDANIINMLDEKLPTRTKDDPGVIYTTCKEDEFDIELLSSKYWQLSPVIDHLEINAIRLVGDRGTTYDATHMIRPMECYQKHVVWSSSDESIVTVSETGLLTYVEKGNATIRCTSLVDENIFAECEVKVIVIPNSISLVPKNAKYDHMHQNDIWELEVVFDPIDSTERQIEGWSSSNPNLISVDDKGIIKGIGSANSMATITCTSPVAKTNKIGSLDVYIKQPTQYIEISESSIILDRNTTHDLIITPLPDSACHKDVIWSVIKGNEFLSLNPNEDGTVCTVTAVEKGNAVVRCTSAYDERIYVECNVKVIVIPNKVHITPIKGNFEHMHPGDVWETELIFDPADSTEIEVEWSSSNPDAISIDNNGVITAIGNTTSNVTITCTSPVAKVEKTDSFEVDLRVPLNSMGISETSLVLDRETSHDLSITFSPIDACHTDVMWEVVEGSDLLQLEPNEDGTRCNVTAVQKGNAVVRCTSVYDESIYVECNVEVIVIPNSISIAPIKGNFEHMHPGDVWETELIFDPVDSTEIEVEWESSNPDIISIDNNGVITAIGNTTSNVTITCTSPVAKEIKTDSFEVELRLPINEIVLSETSLELDRETSHELVATLLPTDVCHKDVVWEVVTGGELLSIEPNEDGTRCIVTAVEKGNAVVRCSSAMDKNIYAECNVKVIVIPKEIILSTISTPFFISEKRTISYTFIPSDSTEKDVIWSSSDENIATVNKVGMLYRVTAIGKGDATITCKAAKGEASASRTFHINIGYVEITKDLPARMDKGETFTIETKTYYRENLPLIWESSNPEVATVDENGIVTVIGESGDFNIRCTIDGDPEYYAESNMCTVNVYPAEILITSNKNVIGYYNDTFVNIELGYQILPSNYNVEPEGEISFICNDDSVSIDENNVCSFSKVVEGGITINASLGNISGSRTFEFSKLNIVIELTGGSGSIFINKTELSLYTVVGTQCHLGGNTYGWYIDFDIKEISFDSGLKQNLKRVLELDTSNVTSTASMFSNCGKLEYVCPLDVSNVTNMDSMFSYCKSLTSLDVSSWDVSNVTDMNRMFCNCSSLTSIGDLSNWDVSNVYDMATMFYGCSLLETLELSKWVLSNIESAQSMFNGCRSLTSIGDLSNWDVSNVYDMAYMFYKCSSLTSIGDLSNWDVSNVSFFAHMFNGCSSLTSIGDLSNWDVSNVYDGAFGMNSMFNGCSSLTSIGDLSNWDVSGVTSMNSMFSGCSSLTSIILSGWNVSNVTSMNSMFSGCTMLEILNLENWSPKKKDNFTNGYSNFIASCENLKEVRCDILPLMIEISNNLYDRTGKESGIVYSSCNPYRYNAKDLERKNWIINSSYVFDIDDYDIVFTTNGPTDVSKILQGVAPVPTAETFVDETTNEILYCVVDGTHLWLDFEDNSELLEVKKIKLTCDSRFPNNTEKMFKNCINLRSVSAFSFFIEVPQYGNKIINEISTKEMFYNCKSLTKFSGLQILNSTDVKIVDTSYMFYGCENLSCYIGSWNARDIKNMSYMFYNCKSLTSANIEGLSSWYTASIDDGVNNLDYMFYGCSSLTSVDLSNWVVFYTRTMRNMFENCSNLSELFITNWDVPSPSPSTWDCSMNNMFDGCEALRIIQCNDGTVINYMSFYVPNRSEVSRGILYAECEVFASDLNRLSEKNWDVADYNIKN